MPLWLMLLEAALQMAPTVASEVEAIVAPHANTSAVQKIAQGAAVLNQVVATAVSVAAPPSPAAAP
jgi:hypothetical protein